jgi:hypothetical protein
MDVSLRIRNNLRPVFAGGKPNPPGFELQVSGFRFQPWSALPSPIRVIRDISGQPSPSFPLFPYVRIQKLSISAFRISAV